MKNFEKYESKDEGEYLRSKIADKLYYDYSSRCVWFSRKGKYVYDGYRNWAPKAYVDQGREQWKMRAFRCCGKMCNPRYNRGSDCGRGRRRGGYGRYGWGNCGGCDDCCTKQCARFRRWRGLAN